MLPNEEFALACLRYYEEQGLIVDETNGEFAHCPLPKGMGDKGYYLLHEHHQQQGLLQSRDVGRACFYNANVKKWLLTANYFPDNFFELWDIYDEFCGEHAKKMREKPSYGDDAWRQKISNGMLLYIEKVGAEAFKMQCQKAQAKHQNPPNHMQKMSKRAAEKRKKRIEVTFPNGRVGVYPSLQLLMKALGFCKVSIYDMCEKGKVHKGCTARYL